MQDHRFLPERWDYRWTGITECFVETQLRFTLGGTNIQVHGQAVVDGLLTQVQSSVVLGITGIDGHTVTITVVEGSHVVGLVASS